MREMRSLSFRKEQIQESLKNNGVLKLRGIIQRADAKNQNGRIYPREILANAIESYMKLVRERRAHGELDHDDQPVVNLKNISHIITDIEMQENGDVIGEIEVLNTPMGNIAKALIEAQVTVGISSRALGSVYSNGDADVVEDDLHFICWDLVSEPSTQQAFMFKEAKVIAPGVVNKIISRDERVSKLASDILNLDKKLRRGPQ